MNNITASPPILVAIYCVLVLFASLAGGWLLLAVRLTHTRLQTAMSFVAGLMLGMALLHFIPHAFHQVHSVDRTVRWALVGFLVMFFLQRFFHYHQHDVSEETPENGNPHARHHHEGEHTHCGHANTLTEEPARQLSWMGTAIGLSLHSLLDGIALAAAVAVDARGHGGLLGVGAALVIVLHKPFDAMAVAALMAAGGCSRFSRHLINALFALATPLGMVLFYLGVSRFASDNPVFLGCALAFCAGTFLCIACADLLPELQFHSHDRFKLSLALAAGLGVAVLIGRFETSGHDHHHAESPAAETKQGHHD
jgi:zinc and cadmium transporter